MRKMKRDFEVTFKGITSRGRERRMPGHPPLGTIPEHTTFRHEALRVEPLRGDFGVSRQTH